MTTVLALTLTLSISAYTPGANRISGGSVMADGRTPFAGAFACPAHVPLGSRVTLLGRARDRAQRLGLPTDGVCTDRFHPRYSAGHLDVCIPHHYAGLNDAGRLQLAYAWGRVRGHVRIDIATGGNP